MAGTLYRKFSTLVRERRRQLNLNQKELASRLMVSVSYISNLETGKRRPSDTILSKLADVLGLDAEDLKIYTNARIARQLTSHESSSAGYEGSQLWKTFLDDKAFCEEHCISEQELRILSKISTMGQVRSVEDVLFILSTIRRELQMGGR